MDKEQIKKLPTIIDVIDNLAPSLLPELFWEHVPSQISSPFGISPEERYELYQRDDGKVSLIPSGNRQFYYRGQNDYFDLCQPSLLRIKDKEKEKKIIELLMRNEFMELLSTHPIIAALEDKDVYIDKMALAQHYCFCTPFLDLTCDIWAAAFFATAIYDSATDTYSPADESFGKGFGVLYVSKEKVYEHPKIIPLGYNFFPRPHKQMGSVYVMEGNDNFNDEDLFEKHRFRHDKIASQRMFEMAFRQRKYWNHDPLAVKAYEIKQSKTISRKVLVDLTRSEGVSEKELQDICKAKGYTITDIPTVAFEEQYIEKTKREWETNAEFIQLRNKIQEFMMIKIEEDNSTDEL